MCLHLKRDTYILLNSFPHFRSLTDTANAPTLHHKSRGICSHPQHARGVVRCPPFFYISIAFMAHYAGERPATPDAPLDEGGNAPAAFETRSLSLSVIRGQSIYRTTSCLLLTDCRPTSSSSIASATPGHLRECRQSSKHSFSTWVTPN